MVDRQNEIFNSVNNIAMCQNNCKFVLYNSTNKKAKCECETQIEKTILDEKEINFKQELVKSFFRTLTNSNFLILKCFKLVFSKKGQIGNKGSYIMSILIIVFLIFVVLYSIFGNRKINFYIENIIKQKMKINKNNENIIYKNKKPNKKIKNQKYKNNKKTKLNNSKTLKDNSKQSLKKDIYDLNILKRKSKDKKNENKNHAPPRITSINKKIDITKHKNSLDNKINKKPTIFLRNSKKGKIIDFTKNKKNKKKGKTKSNIINNNVIIYNMPIPLSSSEHIKNEDIENTINRKDNLDIHEINTLNDQELNSLEYEKALQLDKRTYFQFYCSLLKKKQLLIFTFLPSYDYNLISIKISLFILTFALYYTINGFFFTDETMHNVYKSNGNFDIILQIPKILYSSLITAIINTILKYLSLSENSLLDIKKIKKVSVCKKKSKTLERCLKIKFIIFFIFSFLFMIFFWYFICCFCAVYRNTQNILLKNTLLSFAISMLYPLGLSLIPGFFRIPSLKSSKKNKKCLYILSSIYIIIT